MVKMVLGSSDSQANSVSSLASNRMAAFQSTMDALTNFIATTNLTGNAYENAQQYAQSTLIPLLQAAILYEENLSTAVGKIPSEYRNTEHLGEDLDSEELEEELQALDMTRSSLMESIRVSEQHDLNGSTLNSNGRNTQSLRGQLRTVNQRREKIMQQLAALAAYSATSVTFFDGLTEVPSDLKSALAMVSGDMSSFSGEFPERKDIGWTKKVHETWSKREAALAALTGDDVLSEEEVEKVAAYVGVNGSLEKEILLYDNLYGYAKYNISLKKTQDGKLAITLTGDEVNNISAGGLVVGKGSLSGTAKIPKSGIGGFGSSVSAGITTTGIASASYKIGDDQKSTTVKVDKRNGQTVVATSTSTTVSAKKVSGSIVYEQGYYVRNYPPKTASATQSINGFDWGDIWNGVVQTAGGVAGAIKNTAIDVGGFLWENKEEIGATILVAGFIGGATAIGGPAGFAGSTAIVGGGLILDDLDSNGGNNGI